MTYSRNKKRLGQHFLHDQTIIQRIIKAIDPRPEQTIIEIGPGKSALTRPLLQYLDHLHVIEVDPVLAHALNKQYQHKKITIHCIDVLAYDFSSIAKPFRVIGNLPYNISTPLIFKLLTHSHLINDMLFMLQEEVVNRLCAQPNSKNYGRLAVMVQAHCNTEKIFSVSQQAFSPPPKVMSAVVKLTMHNRMLEKILHYPSFAKIVKQTFSERRKTLKNCLKNMMNEQQIKSIGIMSTARAETLEISQFIQLANAYYTENSSGYENKVD